MKLSIDLKNLKVLKKFVGNVTLILWLALGLIAVLTGFVIYGEINKVRNTQTDQNVINSQIVRVNLLRYQEMEKRLNDNMGFQPRPIAGSDAFGYPPPVPSSK